MRPRPQKLMRRYEDDGSVRFLTFSCYRRLPLLRNDRIKDRFAAHLARATQPPDVRLIAWVVMPDHVHLLLQPNHVDAPSGATASLQCRTRTDSDHCKDAVAPDAVAPDAATSRKPRSITRVLYDLKRPFARDVIARWRELDAPVLRRITDKRGRPHFWQSGGGYDRNLRTAAEINEKIDYIHANPPRRALCRFEQDWPWSSIHAYDGVPYVGPRIDPPL
ncbi:MAG: transposase [Planctomycetota bacterium]